MAFAMFLFSGVDTIAKFLTSSLHPVQIVWIRQAALALGVLVIIGIRGRIILRTSNLGLQIGRGTAAALSATAFIVAVSFVPLADAVAVSFVAPFMVTVMGAFFLGEKVGIRRWVAVTIGFLGSLIVIRPGMGVMHPAVFLVIVAAALFALRQILSRRLSGADSTTTTVAYTALTSFGLLTLGLPFVWQTPDWGPLIGLLFAMSLVAAFAEIMVIKALEVGEAVAVAPVHYSILIWSTFYGWMVFGHLPDGWTWIGAAIIMASGLYTLRREAIAAKND